ASLPHSEKPRWHDSRFHSPTSLKRGSLDHDLGDDAHGTGYDVILWIEEAVALRGFNPPKITIHSANASAAEKMLAGVRAIERLAGH
ncbi:cyclic-phosphate processing receiver domain-containing protein, partial [Ralstonia solanacearum]|uniref:cyclic-phosphate processing receiver domain-containing protein n=1 Tax=Ralstonia solanacearum TaxID=305 RepID=UPI001FD74853